MNTFFPAPKTKAEANETIAGLRRLADGWWAMSKGPSGPGTNKASCKRSFRAAEAEIEAIRAVLPNLPESA